VTHFFFMNYGYDTKTGHLFVVRGLLADISYAGQYIHTSDIPDELSEVRDAIDRQPNTSRLVSGAKQLENLFLTPELAAWHGAYFLSGMNKKRILILHYDKQGNLNSVLRMFDNIYVPVTYEPSLISYANALIFSGHFQKYIDEFPLSNPVYACPLHDEIEALGALVAGMPELRTRRVDFFKENDQPLFEDVETKVFDPVLDDDCLGQMALAINQGCVVYNDTRRGIGNNGFYNTYLSKTPLINEPICLMTSLQAKEFFPDLPLIFRYYVCSCLPMKVKTTPELAKVIGRDISSVFLRVVGPYDHELRSFLGFAHKGSHQSGIVFGASSVELYPKTNIYWFLRKRVYKLSVQEFANKRGKRCSKKV